MRFILPALVCCSLWAAPWGSVDVAADTILLNDSFTDLDRSNQGLPGSAAWYSGGAAADISAASGALVMQNITGGNRGGLSYFTASGNPQVLSIGDSLTLQANVTIPASSGDAGRFQFWAYNSGGSRTTSDNQGFNATTYSGYTGYGMLDDPIGLHPTRLSLNQRTNTSNNLTLGSYIMGSTAASIRMTNLTVLVSLQLTRSAVDTMDIVGSINGTQISRTDSTNIFTSFDTLLIASANDTAIGTLTVDDVLVTYTPAVIPEPGTAALTGFGLLLLASLRRRLARG